MLTWGEFTFLNFEHYRLQEPNKNVKTQISEMVNPFMKFWFTEKQNIKLTVDTVKYVENGFFESLDSF